MLNTFSKKKQTNKAKAKPLFLTLRKLLAKISLNGFLLEAQMEVILCSSIAERLSLFWWKTVNICSDSGKISAKQKFIVSVLLPNTS